MPIVFGFIKMLFLKPIKNGSQEMVIKPRAVFKAIRDKYRCMPLCFLVINDFEAFWLPVRYQRNIAPIATV